MLEMICPIGLGCAQMGAVKQYCANYEACASAARSLPGFTAPEEADEPPEENFRLCEENPNVFWTCYWAAHGAVKIPDPVTGWFWKVKLEPPHRGPLDPGYAEAEPANLPIIFIPGEVRVVADREICREDGSFFGSYAKAVPNPAFWLQVYGERVIAIEWNDPPDTESGARDIRQIFTENAEYYCALQKNGTLLLEGGENDSILGDYWAAPDRPDPEAYGDKARRISLPQGENLGALKQALEGAAFAEEILWCQVCQDHTYEERYGASECGHLRYSDELGSWSGCGYAEESFSEEYAASFQALCQEVIERAQEDPRYYGRDSPERLIEWLQNRELRAIWRFTDRHDSRDAAEPARKYLDSLTESTPQEYLERAITWVQAGDRERSPG